MAVFDIDNTILDSTQRFKDAQRAGLVDKDGKAKKKRVYETMGKAMQRRNDFLYKPTNLAKDRVISGALAFITELVSNGYAIAYLTARPFNVHTQTVGQLEEKGFPLFKGNDEEVLVFSKAKLGEDRGNYKARILRQLSGYYDVRMFFDDDKDTLKAVGSDPSLDIPGIYSSIKEYRQYSTRSNPYQEASADDFFPGPANVAPYYMTAQTIPITALQNPPVKPRRKKMKNGKYRKEPAKKYIDRFMGDPKMNKEFPDRGQRYAVSLQYVEKFYGKRGLDSVGARRNPEEYSEDYMVPRDIHRLGKAADRLEDTYEDGQEVPEWWKSKLSVTAKDADTIADSLDYVAQNPSDCPPATQSLELNTKNRNNAIQSDYIRYGPLNLNDLRYYDDAAAHWNTDVATAKKSKCSNCVAFDISPRMLECMPGPVSEPIEDEEGYLGYCWMHHFKCHSARTCYTWAAGGPISDNKVSMEWQDRAFGKKNPAGALPIFTGEPTSKFTNKGMISAEVQIGRNVVKDVGEVVQSIYRGLVGGRTTIAERRMAMAVASMQKELSDRAKAKGANAIANLNLDYELIQQSATLTLIATADAIKMRSPPKTKMTGAQYRSGVKKMLEAKSNPRKNPSHSKKVEKGKKLYKHMNGKEPEKIEKKKIDMGDVWYQVGEGGCWQIGYMSGKETGNANQKYTHTFNEETQDGNFPKLYATMPESGKPLLIIQGGTWKIKTDDQGVAWIYD